MHKLFLSFFIVLIFNACNQAKIKITATDKNKTGTAEQHNNPASIKVIHVFVALCDNKYQGIVPVPAKIGNGQDAANNLYWGCGYGVKTFFASQKKLAITFIKKKQ